MNELDHEMIRNALREVVVDESRRPTVQARIDRGITRRRNGRRLGASALMVALVGVVGSVVAFGGAGRAPVATEVITAANPDLEPNVDENALPEAPVGEFPEGPVGLREIVTSSSDYVVVWGSYGDASDETSAYAADGAVLDLAAGTWNALPTQPDLPGRVGATGVIVGDQLIVIGGHTREEPQGTDVIAAIDLNNGTARTLGSSELARRSSGTAFLQGSKVVLVGGYDETTGASRLTTAIMDTATWEWSEAGPAPWSIDNLLATGRVRPDVWSVAETPLGLATMRVAMLGADPVAEIARFDPDTAEWIITGSALPPDAVPFELGSMTSDADSLWFAGHLVTDTQDGTRAVQVDVNGLVLADIPLHDGCVGFTQAVRLGEDILIADGCSALRITGDTAQSDDLTASIDLGSSSLRLLPGTAGALLITSRSSTTAVRIIPAVLN